jgi:hypothetical protein
MSGSSGTYTPGGPPASDCNIVERTPLNSPKANVVRQLTKGDMLEVEVSADGRSLLARAPQGLAGSLTPRRLAELLECIEKGRKYKATVVDLKGGFCEVEIRPK